MKRSAVIIRVLIFLGILVVVNLLSNRVYFRADFTEDERYTLSTATKTTLMELEDVITISAYFTKDLPPQLLLNRQEFENLLVEYEKRSDGNVIYEFINPNESPAMESEAQQKGIRPVIINVTESDQVKQLRAYMGAILQQGERVEVIPLLQPGFNMEFGLTTAIKMLTVIDRPKVGLLQGHGEPPISSIPQLAAQLSVLYDLEAYTINDSSVIPRYYESLLILNPTDTVPSKDLDQIDNYLRSGGNLLVTYSRVLGNLNQGILNAAPDIGVATWLASKGVGIGDQFVIDANSGSIGVQQQQGPFMINTQVKFPYFPIIGNFADHPASKGIESLILPLVSPITLRADSTVVTTVLAKTSENSGIQPSPVYIDINHQWTLNDFRDSGLPVAVAMENTREGSRLAVVSNGNFVINGEGQQTQQLNPDNVNFASNIVDWLSDDTGLIDLRTKGITNRPLKQLGNEAKAMIKYGNVFAPILLIIVYALIRKQQYLRKKAQWLQGNY